MKMTIKVGLCLCATAIFAAPAGACCLFPFGGWWGAGYNAAPAYASYGGASYAGYYGSSYGTYYGGSMMAASDGCCGNVAPMYSVGYGSYNSGSCGSGCCVSSCCDSCGSSCGSGCGSGSCIATEPAGSLKPVADPNLNKSKSDYEDEDPTRVFPSAAERERRRRLLEEQNQTDPDQKDLFKRSGTESGSGSGTKDEFEPFDINPDYNSKKPEVPDPLKDEQNIPEGGTPKDNSTFLPEIEAKPADSAFRNRELVIARTSSLSEVIAPRRLASRSLPSMRPVSASKIAGDSDGKKSDPKRPLRWISAPLPTGHVSL